MEDLPRGLDPGEPVEPLLAPEGLLEVVGHLDPGDPLGVLEPEFGRRAQPQRKSERIGERIAGIFGRQHGLRMQRRGHVEAFGVIIGAAEEHIFGAEIGTDALQELTQVHARTTDRYSPNPRRRCGG